MLAIINTRINTQSLRAFVDDASFGAILVFEGVARDHFEGRSVQLLEYQAYAPMAEAVLNAIQDEIKQKWPTVRVSIVHRTGVVQIGEPSVVIATGAPHRPECYEANRYALEAIKDRLPVWKKEIYSDGNAWKANASS